MNLKRFFPPFLEAFCTFHGVRFGNVHVNALHSLSMTKDGALEKFILCTRCSLQLRSSPITWKCQHVHGHQDKHVKYKDLSQEAQANVVVDGETKDQLQRVYAKEEGLLGAKGEPWFVQCKEDAKSGLNNVTFQFTKHTDRSSY